MQHANHTILATLDRIDQIILYLLRNQRRRQFNHLRDEIDLILHTHILRTEHILVISH